MTGTEKREQDAEAAEIVQEPSGTAPNEGEVVRDKRSLASSDFDRNEQEDLSKERRVLWFSGLFSGKSWQMFCAPISGKELPHLAPLLLSLCSFVLTGFGSWRCSYFKGATISFTGGNYGLWTLEDGTGSCQQWDVLFFSYSLGGPLIAARIFSMASLLFGLGLLTTMAQASRIHAVSWFLGFLLLLLFLVSVSTTSNYNLWVTFFLFTYISFILIVRSLFIHPVYRKISPRGCKILGSCCLLCAVCCLLTLVVLKSDFCTCDSITADKLEGRDPGDPCDGECRVGAAGAIMIVASFFWMATGITVVHYGIQADIFEEDKRTGVYAHYPRGSITTRIVHAGEHLLKKEAAMAAQARTIAAGGFSRSAGSDLEKTNNEGVEASESMEISEPGENQVTMDVEPLTELDDASLGKDDEDSVDERSRCKKFCCDYRVLPRNRKERWAFWSFRVMLGFIFMMYIFIIVVKIGSRIENTEAAKAPDTSYNFITDVVCGIDPLNPSSPLVTFPTKQDAVDAGYQVAHCGACGHCSNVRDIKIYVDTRETIAKTSKKCGVNVVLGDYEDVVNCLEGRIGFSRACTECWADNMESTARHCLFTCMTVMFTGLMSNNNVEGAGDRGWLNQCLFCDEKLSGPAFVSCSGVARRRLGIKSEIERNPEEQCSKADFDWLDVDWSRFGF